MGDGHWPDRSATRAARLGLVIVAVLSFLLLLPFLRMVAGFGDEGVILHGAARILEGRRLYADFFEFLPPGSFLIVAGWLAATDVSLFSARLLVAIAIVAIACLTYINCLRVSRSPAIATVLVAMWGLATNGPWLQVSHHWFTTFFSVVLMWAALVFVEGPRRPLLLAALAGLAGGAAAMVIPNRGALALIAGLAAFARLRGGIGAFVTYCAAALAVPAAIIAWLAHGGNLDEAFAAVILHTLKNYAGVQGVPYGHAAGQENLILLALLPVAAILLLSLVAAERRRAMRDAALHVCAAFMVTAYLAITVRLDIFKLMVVAPMVLPLVALCAARAPLPTFRRRPGLIWALGAILMLPSAIGVTRSAIAVLRNDVAATPRGGVRFAGPLAQQDVVRRVLSLPAGERVFFYPYLPLMPFLTARDHPVPIDLFIPNYTTRAQYAVSCRAAMSAEWVVFDTSWTDEVMAYLFPYPGGYAPEERVLFEVAIRRGFAPVARIGTFEVLQQTSEADVDLCRGIGPA